MSEATGSEMLKKVISFSSNVWGYMGCSELGLGGW
jgi:hypothetical protein